MSVITDPSRRRLPLPNIVVGQTNTSGGRTPRPGAVAGSPLTDILPQFLTRRAYFHSVEVPNGFTISTGDAGWYGLARFTTENIGQEFNLSGVSGTMMPTDSAGGALTGFSNPLAWGDSRGISAAIVIGRNLGCELGSWSSAPAPIPGIGYGDAAPVTPSLRSDNAHTLPDYTIVQGFPTGTFRDTAPNKPPLRWSFAPHALRVRDGQTLEAALVVRGAQVHNLGVSGQFIGLADFALVLGLTASATEYGKR